MAKQKVMSVDIGQALVNAIKDRQVSIEANGLDATAKQLTQGIGNNIHRRAGEKRTRDVE